MDGKLSIISTYLLHKIRDFSENKIKNAAIRSRIQHQLIKTKSHIIFAAGAEIVDVTIEQSMVGRLKSPHF